MTKEEIIRVFEKMQDAFLKDTEFRNAIDKAITLLSQPSLPSNLDEAAEEIVKEWNAYGDGEYKKLAIAGAEYATPRWISIDDRLPKMDEDVIVLTIDDGFTHPCPLRIGFGHIVDTEATIMIQGKPYKPESHNGWNIPGVKYWMPCPEIPEV